MAAGGEHRHADSWMPPLEARELGAGIDAGGRYKLSPLSRWLIGAALAVTAIVVIGRVIAVAEGPREGSPESVASGFVEARIKGDAAGACDRLTPRARRDMVALVRGIEPTAASAADCERFILTSSESSQFTDPALPRFSGRELRVLHYPGADGMGYAKVEADGIPGAVLELRLVGGKWKLDGLAAERVSFMAGCTDKGAPRAYCGCLFDRLAGQGHASNEEFAALSRGAQERGGAISPLFQRAANACAR